MVEDPVAGHVIPAESGDVQRGATLVVRFADLRVRERKRSEEPEKGCGLGVPREKEKRGNLPRDGCSCHL